MRLKAEVRKADLLAHALEVARKVGYMQMTRQNIAKHAKVTDGLVSHHWGTMVQLRRAVMRHAVHVGDAEVVAQGLSHRDNAALKAPPELRERAAATLIKG